MNPIVRFFLRLKSKLKIDMRKNYKTVRNIQQAVTPDLKDRYRIFDHKIYSPEGGHNIPIRVFLPNRERKPGALLFFHGGGWVIGNIETYTPTCAYMADMTGQIVYSVDYRLAPEYPFPSGLDDCYYATEYLMRHYEKVEAELAGDFTLIGDSAGANLAAAISLRLRDEGQKLPDKQILIYPATYWDHNAETSPFESVRTNGTDYGLTSQRIQEYLELYVPNSVLRKTQAVSPLMAADLTNQPATLLLSAEFDPLRDEGEAYALLLKEAGNEVTLRRILKAPHGFINYPNLTGGIEESYRIINLFLYDQPFEQEEQLETHDVSVKDTGMESDQKIPSDQEDNSTGLLRKKLREIKAESEKSRELSSEEITFLHNSISKIKVKV